MKKTSVPRRKAQPRSKINPNAEHIPGLDDYDLPPHIDIDYSKARPNPYAGRARFSHGGRRPGAGRKPGPQPVERHTISLYKEHARYLRSLDENLSQAIRKLIAKARKPVAPRR
jgi:hypothetical protein